MRLRFSGAGAQVAEETIERCHRDPNTPQYPAIGAPSGGAFQYLTKDRQLLSFGTSGNLKTIASPAGPTIMLNYSGTPEVLSSVTNNLGRALYFTYSGGLLKQVSDDSGRSAFYTQDGASNLTAVTDPAGNITTYAYDRHPSLIKHEYY